MMISLADGYVRQMSFWTWSDSWNNSRHITHALGFGNDVNFEFLEKLALTYERKIRRVYEGQWWTRQKSVIS